MPTCGAKPTLVLVANLVLAVSTAHAIPSLAPHPHNNGTIFFEDDGTRNGSTNHNHLFNRSSRHSAAAGFRYDALAVWDNRSYRSDFNQLLKTPREPAVYAHGFIQDGQEPRYKFADGAGTNISFDDDKKGLIKNGIQLWIDAAKAQSQGKTTPDATKLVTGIGLKDAADNAEGDVSFEFRIGFFDNLQETHNTVGMWLTDPLQHWGTMGGPTAADLAKPVLAFDDDVKWLFDQDKTPTGMQVDFFTIALHELGHVFGLDHPTALTGEPLQGPAGVLMRGGIGIDNAMEGKKFRMVDPSSARGAASLYTQPVPLPLAAHLLGAALIALNAFARVRDRLNTVARPCRPGSDQRKQLTSPNKVYD